MTYTATVEGREGGNGEWWREGGRRKEERYLVAGGVGVGVGEGVAVGIRALPGPRSPRSKESRGRWRSTAGAGGMGASGPRSPACRRGGRRGRSKGAAAYGWGRGVGDPASEGGREATVRGEQAILMAHLPLVRHKYVDSNGAPPPGAPLEFCFTY